MIKSNIKSIILQKKYYTKSFFIIIWYILPVEKSHINEESITYRKISLTRITSQVIHNANVPGKHDIFRLYEIKA